MGIQWSTALNKIHKKLLSHNLSRFTTLQFSRWWWTKGSRRWKKLSSWRVEVLTAESPNGKSSNPTRIFRQSLFLSLISNMRLPVLLSTLPRKVWCLLQTHKVLYDFITAHSWKLALFYKQSRELRLFSLLVMSDMLWLSTFAVNFPFTMLGRATAGLVICFLHHSLSQTVKCLRLKWSGNFSETKKQYLTL